MYKCFVFIESSTVLFIIVCDVTTMCRLKSSLHGEYPLSLPRNWALKEINVMFSDRYVWANSADPDQTTPRGKQCSLTSDCTLEEQSDQGLHCLPFHLQFCL